MPAQDIVAVERACDLEPGSGKSLSHTSKAMKHAAKVFLGMEVGNKEQHGCVQGLQATLGHKCQGWPNQLRNVETVPDRCDLVRRQREPPHRKVSYEVRNRDHRVDVAVALPTHVGFADLPEVCIV